MVTTLLTGGMLSSSFFTALSTGDSVSIIVTAFLPVASRELTTVPEFLQSAVAVMDEQNAQQLLKTRAYNYRGRNTILRNIKIVQEEKDEQ